DQPIIRPEAGRGMVFQHYSLFPWMTVEKNVLFGLKHAQIPISKKEAQHRAADFLRRVDMLEERKKYPYQLSGGMQQRVAIARALAMDADILLLDEPFGALDIKKRLELQKLLEELWDSGIKRKTVVFVTHDIEEAILLADRIIFMDKGRIEQEIMVPYSRPRNRGVILQSKSYQEIHQKLLHLFYQSGDFIHEQKAI
ncbi:MAG: ABC transporter ATP-binding protein, partial [Clostridiales bacterium]